jgi:peptide/nickel transport system substrate-binding protein
LGRPKTERIFLHYYADANTMIASLLAGEIDVLPAGAQLDTNPLSTIRQAWGTTGGTILPIPKGTRNLIPQLRDSSAPWSDLRARRAIAYALDKQLIVDSLQNGETSPAYTSINPSLPAFQKLEQMGGQKYAYDITQAQRLMTEAGWTKGGDGVYRNAAGQTFSFDITSSNQPKNVQEASAVAAQYTAFGITSNPTPYPASISNATEVRHTYKGMLIWPASSLTNAMEGFSALGIGTEQNRWRGANYGGYRNAEYDRLFEQFGTTLDADKSQELIAQMMKIVADDVGAIPMYYVALSVVYRKGIIGPSGAAPDQAANAWNIHTWDVQ